MFELLLSLLLLSPTSALRPGVVSFDLVKKCNQRTSKLHARDSNSTSNGVSVSLANEFVWYGIKLDIGTPPQTMELQVDTGSSDMWVGNKFNSGKSSTFYLNYASPFSITYGDGSTVSGNYAQDTISISGTGTTIKNANFAYAPNGIVTPQVCGIGLTDNESTPQKYSNLPQQLKEQGQILANVYSLYLGTGNQEGNILFGGVDSSKYTGALSTVPLVSGNQFIVNMDSVEFQGQTVYGKQLQVLLDSGTTAVMLPSDLVNALIGTIQPSAVGYSVDCSLVNSDKAFQFVFSGAKIDVPFRNILDPRAYNPDGSVPSSGTCGVGFQVSQSQVILGDRFLMGAYVVFDLENREVSLANSAGSSANSKIEAVTGPGQVPGAVNAPLYAGKTQPKNVTTGRSFIGTPLKALNGNLTLVNAASHLTTPLLSALAVPFILF